MALNKNDLASAMIAAVKKHPDGGDKAMAALGEAVENYLIGNTSATYSWVGIHTVSGTPDATVSFTAELSASGSTFKSRPEKFADFINDLSDFLNKIKIEAPSGFSLSPLATGAGSFTAQQLGEFSDIEDGERALKEGHEKIAQGIIDGWASFFAPAAAGSRSDYAGSAALVGVV